MIRFYISKDPYKKKKKVCVFAHFAKRNTGREKFLNKENGYFLELRVRTGRRVVGWG